MEAAALCRQLPTMTDIDFDALKPLDQQGEQQKQSTSVGATVAASATAAAGMNQPIRQPVILAPSTHHEFDYDYSVPSVEVVSSAAVGSASVDDDLAFMRWLQARFVLDPSQLQLHQLIGRGAFGVVYEGKYCGKRVAVKLVKRRSTSLRLAHSSSTASTASPSASSSASSSSGTGCTVPASASASASASSSAVAAASNYAFSCSAADSALLRSLPAHVQPLQQLVQEVLLLHFLYTAGTERDGQPPPHLLRFLGAAVSADALMMLSELQELGSVESCLLARSSPPLLPRTARVPMPMPPASLAAPYDPCLALRLRVLLQAAQALEYCHSRRVVHRDVAARNLLLDGAWQCSLADFGLAHYEQTDGETEAAHAAALSHPSGAGMRGPMQRAASEPVAARHSEFDDEAASPPAAAAAVVPSTSLPAVLRMLPRATPVCELVSVRHAAPESIRGSVSISNSDGSPRITPLEAACALDAWSFGVTAWECLAGRQPFEELPGFQVAFKVCEEGARLVLEEAWPPEVCQLMRKCWALRPRDRPAMREAVDCLRRCTAAAAQAQPITLPVRRGAGKPAPTAAAHSVDRPAQLPMMATASLDYEQTDPSVLAPPAAADAYDKLDAVALAPPPPPPPMPPQLQQQQQQQYAPVHADQSAPPPPPPSAPAAPAPAPAARRRSSGAEAAPSLRARFLMAPAMPMPPPPPPSGGAAPAPAPASAPAPAPGAPPPAPRPLVAAPLPVPVPVARPAAVPEPSFAAAPAAAPATLSAPRRKQARVAVPLAEEAARERGRDLEEPTASLWRASSRSRSSSGSRSGSRSSIVEGSKAPGRAEHPRRSKGDTDKGAAGFREVARTKSPVRMLGPSGSASASSKAASSALLRRKASGAAAPDSKDAAPAASAAAAAAAAPAWAPSLFSSSVVASKKSSAAMFPPPLQQQQQQQQCTTAAPAASMQGTLVSTTSEWTLSRSKLKPASPSPLASIGARLASFFTGSKERQQAPPSSAASSAPGGSSAPSSSSSVGSRVQDAASDTDAMAQAPSASGAHVILVSTLSPSRFKSALPAGSRRGPQNRGAALAAPAAPASAAAASSSAPPPSSSSAAPAPAELALARPHTTVAKPLVQKNEKKKKNETETEKEKEQDMEEEQQERKEEADGAAAPVRGGDDDDEEEGDDAQISDLDATAMDDGLALHDVADEAHPPEFAAAPMLESASLRAHFEEPFQLVSSLRAHLAKAASASASSSSSSGSPSPAPAPSPAVLSYPNLGKVRHHSAAVLSATVAGAELVGRVLPEAGTLAQLRAVLAAAPAGLLFPVEAVVEAGADTPAVVLLRRSLLEDPTPSPGMPAASAPTLFDALQHPHPLSTCYHGGTFRPVLVALRQYVRCVRFLAGQGAPYAAGGVRQLPWLAHTDDAGDGTGAGRVQLPPSALLLLHPRHQSHLYNLAASGEVLEARSQELQRARYLSPESVRSGLFGEPAEVWCVGVTMWEAAHAGALAYSDVAEGWGINQILLGIAKGDLRLSPTNEAYNCPAALGQLIADCTRPSALHATTERPTLAEVEARLTAML